MKYTNLTSETFNAEVENSKELVILDFWATWCGPCRMQSAAFDEISDEEATGIKLCKVNVDEQPSLADKFDIHFIPTLIFIKNGEQVLRSEHYNDEDKLKKLFVELK